MEKPKKVHLFFEQSGTFKNEFVKLGVPAVDYDIQNEYGQTDYIIDLFDEINTAYYTNDKTIFDDITPDDLIFAFFPCTYFCENNQMLFCGTSRNFSNVAKIGVLDYIIERSDKRQYFYKVLLMLCRICVQHSIPLIVENPYSCNQYLYNNFPFKPYIDRDRTKRGDHFHKPTQYFFINCEPSYDLTTVQQCKNIKKINQLPGRHNGSRFTGKERSEISPDYARNFICDRILNIRQPHTTPTLF